MAVSRIMTYQQKTCGLRWRVHSQCTAWIFEKCLAQDCATRKQVCDMESLVIGITFVQVGITCTHVRCQSSVVDISFCSSDSKATVKIKRNCRIFRRFIPINLNRFVFQMAVCHVLASTLMSHALQRTSGMHRLAWALYLPVGANRYPVLCITE